MLKASELSLSQRYGYGWYIGAHVNGESLEAAKRLVDELKDAEIGVEIKKWSKPRSLSANAYAWVLMDKIAASTKQDKTDVYRHAIREIGGNTEMVCVLNAGVDKLRASWERNGLGWITDVADSKLDGCTNVILYYGSSTYDTAQMSALIESLIAECKELGIEYLSQAELERMLGKWGAKE